MKYRLLITTVLLLLLMNNYGCASIVGQTSQNITLNSMPNATVTIEDENGSPVYKGQTPATVNLNKSAGYFDGMDYTAVFSKNGYHKKAVPINAGVNVWYIFGNLVFGGLIGWLAVDPWTGAMWDLSPDKINTSLEKSGANPGHNSIRQNKGRLDESD